MGQQSLSLIFSQVEILIESLNKLVYQILYALQRLRQERSWLLEIFVLQVERLEVIGDALADRVLVTAQYFVNFIDGTALLKSCALFIVIIILFIDLIFAATTQIFEYLLVFESASETLIFITVGTVSSDFRYVCAIM